MYRVVILSKRYSQQTECHQGNAIDVPRSDAQPPAANTELIARCYCPKFHANAC